MWTTIVAQTTDSPSPAPPEDFTEATSLLLDSVRELVEAFIARLPLVAIGILVLLVGLVLASVVARVTERGMRRASGDQVVTNLAVRLTRLVVVLAVLLFALSVLGDSAVDFEVHYWTAPEQASVIQVRDRVLRACKSALEDAGMTIPWPIRTVAWDGPLATTSTSPRPPAPMPAPMPAPGSPT